MNKVIIEHEEDCSRVKFGPMVVDPRPHSNTDNEFKQYVATHDEEGPPDFCVSHITPFWEISTNTILWDTISYHVRGKRLFSRQRNAGVFGTFFPVSADVYPVVDGNGYLYYVASNVAASRPWEFRIRQFATDNTTSELILDLRAHIPGVNAFGDPIVHGIAWLEANASSKSMATDASAQNDGIVLFALIHEIPDDQETVPWPTTPRQFIAVYVDSTMTVTNVEWLPVADGASPAKTHEPLVISGVLMPPLPNGYFTTPGFLSFGVLHKFINGTIAAVGPDIGSTFQVFSRTWFHDDGSFWVRYDGQARLLSTDLVDITPAWVAALNLDWSFNNTPFFVTSSPPSDIDGHFRFITIERDPLVADRGWYRVRDKDGTIVLEKERDNALYSDGKPFSERRFPGLLTTNTVGVFGVYNSATEARILAQCTNDQFLVVFKAREGSFTQHNAHKMSADSLIASPSLAVLTFETATPNLIFPKGQWPHFDYTNWSTG